MVILSAILRHGDVIKMVVGELTNDKFGYGNGGIESSGHSLIYQAAVECHLAGIPPDIVSVSRQLGDKLDVVGGTAYLKELVEAVVKQGVRSINELSIQAWSRIIDNLGRLRHLSTVLESYAGVLADREKALVQVEDVDAFISEIIADLWKAQGLVTQDYKPISVGVAAYRRRLEQNFRGRTEEVAPMGWPSFKRARLPCLGGMTVIAGLPGSGKTQLALQIMLGQLIQMRHQNMDGCAAINSYEMTDWRLARRLACCLAGVDSSALSAGEVREGSPEAVKLQEWLEFVETLPIYVDDNNLTTSSRINWQASALHAVHGPLTNLMIDYAELVPLSDKERQESRDMQVSIVFQNGVTCAKQTGAAVHVLSQYNRRPLGSKYKRGGPGALRYGAGGWHGADVVLEVWNPIAMKGAQLDFAVPDGFTDDQVWVSVVKYRDGPQGGHFPLSWEPRWTRFSDPMLPSVINYELYENLDEVVEAARPDY